MHDSYLRRARAEKRLLSVNYLLTAGFASRIETLFLTFWWTNFQVTSFLEESHYSAVRMGQSGMAGSASP